ncbi:hypothetical protein [Ornithinibacillus halotolerans]|uniref:Uncharacterized protein n=1 Tax=Ornithinibacillus halotolerans TaxID=1274357 RepID=A0A916SB27_9BACI|nr:hypothetical protein [Ornithinibacillus halotolerans]GGA92061.1 hypothetical protein GCM10008025_38130 [Ornithinibacillus halotolerans]
MAEVILHQWQNNDQVQERFPYLEDMVETILQQQKNTEEVQLFLFQLEDRHEIDKEKIEYYFRVTYEINFTVQVVTISATMSYEQTSDFLLELLKREITKHDRIYLHLGQGNGSFQHVLSHLCLQHYHAQSVLLMGNGFTVEYFIRIPVTERMSDYQFYHHVQEFLHSGNYQSAKRMLKTRYNHKRINHLLDFGTNLFSLETTLASNPKLDMFDYLGETLRTLDNDPEEIAYVKSMKGIRHYDQTAFIKYLYNYASFLYENEDLVDFIVLYYRLVEETLLYAIGWDYDDRSMNHTNFKKREHATYVLDFPNWWFSRHFYKYNQALREEIARIEKKHRGRVYRSGHTFIGMEHLSERDRYFVNVYLQFNDRELIHLLDLRHEGVSGHGFADFSIEKFTTICGGVSPLAKVEPILEELGLRPEHSLFKLIGKVVLGELGKMETDVLMKQ